ncbi:hypothetical protein DP113_05600 [Brasilonema octagenarum UFV-E1]|uniref:DUF1822 family protein n=1 Tax=Brasilonema sennae CENA114 TaxID=415709 RepID=A0A856MBJ3_9CYAN|nr:DUF1822 family protein [Brasilonema sennae]QDL07449.1 hypothetical protein DP114_05645 [Brasilonema sennae CENA114]QDL13811.1 hypothetical protein DP113_05600 [Brasilonema octagenarum UFV-E1]
MTCAFADPREWWLEISPTIQVQSWQQSQVYATSSSRWCAYINQICLHAFLDWISTEDFPSASVWHSFPGTPAFWEFVNGTAILLDRRRVVLIPSEAIDDSELEVPQEWVDIPSWAADYYLAVQVKPDGEWVRIWGYTTHTELKSLAHYDSVDRTYCIDARHLTKDLNAFSLSYQFCREEQMKAAVASLPQLSTQQAENLVQRLGNSSVTFSRLGVPFTTWGSLLEDEHWRQRLYQQRFTLSAVVSASARQGERVASPQEIGQQSQSSQVQVNLSRWLEGIYDNAWESIETFFASNSSSLAFNFRSSTGLDLSSIKRAKLIDLGIEIESQKVVLLVALIPESSQQVSIRVQLHPANGESYLPVNMKLALLLESGEIIQEVQARVQDNYIQLKRFDGEVGECFSIQVALDSCQITENFVI